MEISNLQSNHQREIKILTFVLKKSFMNVHFLLGGVAVDASKASIAWYLEIGMSISDMALEPLSLEIEQLGGPFDFD